MPLSPVSFQPTPVTGAQLDPLVGIVFPASGGLVFDARYALLFPSTPVANLGGLFPTVMPRVEEAIWQAVSDAASTRAIFPSSGVGIALPATFSVLADISLFAGRDGTYPSVNGVPAASIPVVRGWPAYPGTVPAIGVAEATQSEDQANRVTQAGFAGDAYATDAQGNVIATCAYYSESRLSTVIVELIHTDRDERDRLHDQLTRVIYPLRSTLPGSSRQIREVQISSEKQELPLDEQPIVMYVSLFTVEVWAEALIPTDITTQPVVTQITTQVSYLPPDTTNTALSPAPYAIDNS